MKKLINHIFSVTTFIWLEPRSFLQLSLSILFSKYPNSVSVNKISQQNLQRAIKNGKSLIRVGDGEAMLLTGRSLHFQRYHPALRLGLISMISSYSSQSKYILAVPHFALEDTFETLKIKGRARIWRLFRILFKKFPKDASYADAVSFYYKDSFIGIINSLPQTHELIILSKEENNTTELKQFLNEHHPKYCFFNTPQQNAFTVIDAFKSTILERSKQHPLIVITAMGPAGKVLAYQLCEESIQCIDLGHGIEILGKKEDYSYRL